MSNTLELNGLSHEVLSQLSYMPNLPLSLKRNLHFFDKEQILSEAFAYSKWLFKQSLLDEIAIDKRIKSYQSISMKYDRYYPNRQARQAFNDILGFRLLCDNYDSVINDLSEYFRIVDMRNGKAEDDGYRGVHLYFELSHSHFPIEIQINTFFDRQINNWLHDYVYKLGYDSAVGKQMRLLYEQGMIKNIQEFKEALSNVLSNC